MRWMVLARYARHLPTGSQFHPNILPLVYPKKPELVGLLRLLIGFTSRRAVGRKHGARVFRVARIYHKRLFERLEYLCGTPTGSRVPTLIETLGGQRAPSLPILLDGYALTHIYFFHSLPFWIDSLFLFWGRAWARPVGLVLARRLALASPARSVVGGLVRTFCWFFGSPQLVCCCPCGARSSLLSSARSAVVLYARRFFVSLCCWSE